MSRIETRKYAHRREALIKAVAKRRRKIKLLAIAYKGGKCQLCGYDSFPGALEIHHINPNHKKFGIADKGYTRSWEKVKAELDKCILLCANCHREVGGGYKQLSEEIQIEKRGEFGETHHSKRSRATPSQVRQKRKGVETIPQGSSSKN